MKKLRIFSMVVFVIAAASFGYFKYEQINSKDNQAPAITMDSMIDKKSFNYLMKFMKAHLRNKGRTN